jgi:hypothetical protein
MAKLEANNKSKFNRIAERYDIVTEWDDLWVVWDRRWGVYKHYQADFQGLAFINDHSPVNKLWPTEFEKWTGFYDGRDPPLLLCERSETYQSVQPAETRRHRWHIMKGGDSICHVDTSTPRLHEDDLIPISELSEDKKETKLYGESNLCVHCSRVYDRCTDRSQH